MSAPLEAPGSLGSDELLEEELISWFPDEQQQTSIALKWFEASIERSSDSASAAAWASGCRMMRALKHNYTGVSTILSRLCQQLQSLQQTNQPKGKRNRTESATSRKRIRKEPAASIHGHKEADHNLEPSGSVQRLHVQSLQVPAVPEASEGEHEVRNGLETDGSRVDTSKDPEATCSDLSRARLQRQGKRKEKEKTQTVQNRRDIMLKLLLEIAANGAPLSCRTLFEHFRESVGTTADKTVSSKLRHPLNLICNNREDNCVIEYVVLKREGEEAEKQFIPSKSRARQPPQVLAGVVPVNGMNLYYYKNSKP